jgi:hypothetical protein
LRRSQGFFQTRGFDRCRAKPSERGRSYPRRSSVRAAAQLRLEHDLELDAVGVGEENRVVSWRVIILRRRVENRRADADNEMKVVDVGATVRMKGEVMEAWRMAIVRGRPALRDAPPSGRW